MKRIAVFVDGSNFKSACNLLSTSDKMFFPDYKKLLMYFQQMGDVCGAYYFTALPPKEVDASIRQLTDYLQYNGWILKTKETKTTDKGMKGNMDIDMCVQAFRMSEYITDLILCSGDGDFTPMVEELQSRSVRVTAMSLLRRNSSNMMADELRRQVNDFINIEDVKEIFRLDKPEISTLKFSR